MAIVRLILEIEDVDEQNFKITADEAEELLSSFEDQLASRDYSIYDTRVELEN